MDANALFDQLVQEVSTGIDTFTQSVKNLPITVQKPVYNALDSLENDAREGQEGELSPEQEVWDGLINLVNIDAPQDDISEQEAAYRKLTGQ